MDTVKMLGGGQGGMVDIYAPEMLSDDIFVEEIGTDSNEPFVKAVRAGRAKELNTAIEAVGTATVNSIIPYKFINSGTTYQGILLSDGARMWSVTGGTKTALTFAWGISPTADSVWRGITHKTGVYLVNGRDPGQFFDGSSTLKEICIPLVDLDWSDSDGFTSAVANSGGQLAAGVIYVRLTAENTTRGIESNGSTVTNAASAEPQGDAAKGDDIGTLKFTTTAGTSINNFTITIKDHAVGLHSIDPQATHVNVYRTAVGGTTFYYDGTLAVPGSGSWVYSNITHGLTDTALVASDDLPTDHDTVPVCPVVIGYERRAFYAGAGSITSARFTALENSRIVFSMFDYPEYVRYWDQADTSTEDQFSLNEDASDLVGGVDFADELFMATAKSCYVLIGNGTDSYALQRVSAEIGAIAPRGFAKRGKSAFFVSNDGIYEYYGGAVQKISGPIDKTWSRMNSTYLSKAVLCYYHTTDKLYCAITGGVCINPEGVAQTANNLVLVLEFRGNQRRWKIWDGIYATDMCVSAAVGSGDTADRLYMIDSNNYLWRMETGDCEAEIVGGGGSSNTKSAVIAAGDTIASTTITDATASFYTSGDKLSGCTIWVWDANGENLQVRRISTNTTTQLTVDSAWTVNPAVGWTYAVGGIHNRVVTAAASLSGNPFTQASLKSVCLQHRRGTATDDKLVYTRLYLDQSVTSAGLGTASGTAVSLNVGSETAGNFPACSLLSMQSQGHHVQVGVEGVFVDRSFELIGVGVYYETVEIND